MLTQQRLQELLHYDPDTGVFSWRQSRKGQNPLPGTAHKGGYLIITLDYKHYLAHRLAWLYVTGGWPIHLVEHKDGDKRNNRISNLRDVAQRINLENQRRARSNNRSGVLGVELTSNGRYSARIRENGQRHHLGTYDTADDAHSAYLAAKRQLHEGCTI